MKYNFDIPKQVMFWDYFEEKYCFGIGYKDVIICGCCGSIFEINDVLENTPEDHVAIYPYETWVDLSYEIYGGQYPEEYEGQE